MVVYQYDGLNRVTDTFQDLFSGNLSAGVGRGPSPKGTFTGSAGAIHWEMEYDDDQHQIITTDPLDQEIKRTYDYLDRLSKEEFSSHADDSLDFQPITVTYDYNDADSTTTITEEKRVGLDVVTEVCIYEYDKLDRLSKLTNYDELEISYEYYKQGNRKSVTDPDGFVTSYDYDAKNRLTVAHTDAGDTRYSYWENNLLKSIDYPNGTKADYSFANSYDKADRLTYFVNTLPSGQIASSFEYVYDDNGNRLRQVETHHDINAGAPETTTYRYDDLDRVVEVGYGASGSSVYGYDNVGNRKSEVGIDPLNGQQVNRLYEYDRLNRLIFIDNQLDNTKNSAFDYDENGNRTASYSGDVHAAAGPGGTIVITAGAGVKEVPFAYNIRNELVKTIDGNSADITFDYDHNGQRVKKITTSGETRYLNDEDATLLEYDADGQTLRKYDYGHNLLSMTEVDATSATPRSYQFYLFDGLGSTSEMINLAGSIQVSYQYDAWGNLRKTVGSSTNPNQFTGHEFDPETGLIYAGARYYDSRTGTFITQDSYQGRSESPPSLNRYVYASANPLRYIDPTGHASEDAISEFLFSDEKKAQQTIVDAYDAKVKEYEDKYKEMQDDYADYKKNTGDSDFWGVVLLSGDYTGAEQGRVRHTWRRHERKYLLRVGPGQVSLRGGQGTYQHGDDDR